jgi:hypothetical protein
MDTVIVQINNSLAYKILKNLEELKLIKLLKKNVPTNENLSSKYAGKLPANVADELKIFINESRNEWDKRNI